MSKKLLKSSAKPPIKRLLVAVKGAATLAIDELEPFQGDLKTLSKEDYEGLRQSLIENGISFTVHVWKHKNKNYIIDGHQRVWAMKHMRDNEGYHVPEIPVSHVEAKSFKDAKRKVLAGVSRYGKMTEKSLFNFLKEIDIPLDAITSTYFFPDINPDKFLAMFNINELKIPKFADDDIPPEMRSAGDGVRQIQLFLDSETHNEFMLKVNALSKAHEKDNITDTIVEVVREAFDRLA